MELNPQKIYQDKKNGLSPKKCSTHQHSNWEHNLILEIDVVWREKPTICYV